MEKPLVSIIIPTYNRAHLIGETLDSVLSQTYSNWECIVVDDGSTDATSKILETYCKTDSRFQYHNRPINKPKGANACRNYGFELSKGEYVNWFDDDDLMHPNKLSIQLEALNVNNFNFSVCNTLIFKNTIENIIGFRSKEIYSKNIFYDYLSQKIVWLTQAPIWKTSFLKSLDYLFDEELQAAQEWEFYCRILYLCGEYNVVNMPLVYIREHANSITHSNKLRRDFDYYLARKKIYTNNKMVLDEQSINYLENYFINNFKNIVRSRKAMKAMKFFYLYILRHGKLSRKGKFFSILSIYSYLTFNKGDVFLRKIKY